MGMKVPTGFLTPSARDPVTFVLAAVVLAVIGAAATLVPARATAIDPARALQAE
jgi:hypothetical protein